MYWSQTSEQFMALTMDYLTQEQVVDVHNGLPDAGAACWRSQWQNLNAVKCGGSHHEELVTKRQLDFIAAAVPLSPSGIMASTSHNGFCISRHFVYIVHLEESRGCSRTQTPSPCRVGRQMREGRKLREQERSCSLTGALVVCLCDLRAQDVMR